MLKPETSVKKSNVVATCKLIEQIGPVKIMETSSNQFLSNGKTAGGMWNNAKVTYSKETHEMLKVMMEESKLTNIQRRKINRCLNEGSAWPQTNNPTSSKPPSHPKRKSIKPGSSSVLAIPRKRTAANCRAGDSYKKEAFGVLPTRDFEKEKKRLQDIMELGKEPSKPCQDVPVPEVKKDRFQEVLDEIEERRKFLSEMTALGQAKNYQNSVSSEISQRIRELEILDKVRSAELQTKMTSEKT